MNARTQKVLRSAEKAVGRLVEECRKGGPLYAEDPGAGAQVSRTATWLLNARARLHREQGTPPGSRTPPTREAERA